MNIICFGQQPCGFFPKRYLVAKINSARALQQELATSNDWGKQVKIVFFYHDSDADYRETITVFNDLKTGDEVRLNFLQTNKIQKKFSPLYLKRIPPNWKSEILKQLPRFLPTSSPPGKEQGEGLIELFKSTEANTVADFCLKMYKKMGLLDGIEVVRSSDENFRKQALNLEKYFADVEYEGEIVRAKLENGKLLLHQGGGVYFPIPFPENISKEQKNPDRDQRFAWMQSVIHCTHYVTGNSEYNYLKKEDFPEVQFVKREQIENPELAFIPS